MIPGKQNMVSDNPGTYYLRLKLNAFAIFVTLKDQ